MATGQSGGTVFVISWVSKEIVRGNAGSISSLKAIEFSADGMYLVVVNDDGVIKKWNTESRRLVTVTTNSSEV